MSNAYSNESFVPGKNKLVAFPLEAAPFPIREGELAENHVVVGSRSVCEQFKNNRTYCLTIVRKMSRSAIKRAVGDVVAEAESHPDLLYLFTTVGCGDVGWSVREISQYFIPALWTRNIRLPKEFIDSIVAEVERGSSSCSDFTVDQLSELRNWKREEAFKNAERKYGNVFRILPRENVCEFLDVIADAEAGIYNDGGDLNKTRETIRLVFFFLHDRGIIMSNPQDLCECGEEFNKVDIAPRHIKTFMYSVIGLVNPGSHVRPNKPKKLENTAFEDYRTAVDGGKYRFLTQSLAYMVLNILEWCSTLEAEKGEA